MYTVLYYVLYSRGPVWNLNESGFVSAHACAQAYSPVLLVYPNGRAKRSNCLPLPAQSSTVYWVITSSPRCLFLEMLIIDHSEYTQKRAKSANIKTLSSDTALVESSE